MFVFTVVLLTRVATDTIIWDQLLLPPCASDDVCSALSTPIPASLLSTPTPSPPSSDSQALPYLHKQLEHCANENKATRPGSMPLNKYPNVPKPDFLSYEDVLVKYVLDAYKSRTKFGRPVLNFNDTLKVEFSVQLKQIVDLDEKEQVLTLNVWDQYVSTGPCLPPIPIPTFLCRQHCLPLLCRCPLVRNTGASFPFCVH
ncbi:hypothetical protein C0Q70_00855 [Pomacea canaliculata]|uniref:Neurotransmitter-gated ion-channel ligand-binding domain-containing protein n=1 Tax=Pomacea canaliculata TaxID=400727 RepID=A0A2T7PXU6_POMCA|nr:hypothetical protein C0Q70_00855 [Pomacea canaliculata]